MGLPPTFNADIYEIVRQIPAGIVVTYGQIARLICMPNHSRSVGRAMAHAPADAGIPCHRVVGSGGRMTALWPAQRHLLGAEGVPFTKSGCVELKKCAWPEIR